MFMLLVCGNIYRGHMGFEFNLAVIFVLSSILIIISSILPVTPMVWGAAAKYMRKTLASLSKRGMKNPLFQH